MNEVERSLIVHCRDRLTDASARRDNADESPWLSVLYVAEVLGKLERGDFSGQS